MNPVFRKRQSLQTGFIHQDDTIPLVENFCFASALFQTRQADPIGEAKNLLDRLLAFRVGPSFPVYLHEFPVCRDSWQGRKIFPIIYWIQHDFGAILGEPLREKLREALAELPRPLLPNDPQTPESWADFVIAVQLEGREPREAFSRWNPVLHTFRGPQKQERGEPAPTLFDLMMAEAFQVWPKRLCADHPVHLKGAFVRPFASIPPIMGEPLMEVSSTFYWGGPEALHSLHLDASGSYEDGIITLGDAVVADEVEIAYYLNIHPENKILFSGTTFQLGQSLFLGKFCLQFELIEGFGRFFGHLRKGNRPGQIVQNNFEAYDWVIALRTVQRNSFCRIKTTVLKIS